MSSDIDSSDFKRLFTRQIVRVVDTSRHPGNKWWVEPSEKLYKKWRDTLTKRENALKEREEAKKFNAANQAILDKLDQILGVKKDSGSVDIRPKLQNLPIYSRRILVDATNALTRQEKKTAKKRGLLDPLPDTSSSFLYAEEIHKINMDSISLRIENGYITSVILYPDSISKKNHKLNRVTVCRRYFDLRSSTEAAENLDYYIPLESIYTTYKYKIKKDNSGIIKRSRSKGLSSNKTKDPPNGQIFSNLYINLSELVGYMPNIDSIGDVLVHVKNRNISFSKLSQKPLRLHDKDFNSFAQLNVFSDVIGLSEDKPNGIIQVEGKFHVGLLTQPLFNNRYYSRIRWNFLHSVSLSVGFQKIENKLKYLNVKKDSINFYNVATDKYDIAPDSVYKNVRSIDLLQFASLDVSAKFNFIRMESDFTIINAYGGIGLVRTPINDTTIGTATVNNETVPVISDNKTVINSLKTFYGIQCQFKSTSSLGVELGVEWSRLRFNSTHTFQTYSFFDKVKRKVHIREERKVVWDPQIFIPTAQIYYYLDRDQSARIYARARYFISSRSKTDDFFSLQIGYSTDLRGFFSQFKKKGD